MGGRHFTYASTSIRHVNVKIAAEIHRPVNVILCIHHHKMFGPPKIIVDTYSCLQCSHRAAFVFQLDHHVQRNHRNVYEAEPFHATVEPELFFCKCCRYKNYCRLNMYDHYKRAHNVRIKENDENVWFCEQFVRYRCDDCVIYESDTSLSLLKHRYLCERKLTRLPQEIAEQRGGPIVKPDGFKCDHCAHRSKHKSDLRKHVIYKHATDEEITWFQCNHCSYRAKQKLNLRSHMLRHAADEEITWFQCNHCSYRAKRNRQLTKHMLRHAADDEIVWFQCKHCSYRAKEKSNLKMHMLKHTASEEINWFRCRHCSYKAKQNSHLKRHMLQHAATEEIQWFRCDQCSYRAKRKSYLGAHMLRHVANEEINWFECGHCSYRAKRKAQLKIHLLQHAANEEIKWFQCDHCSYRAKQKAHIKKHMNCKHGLYGLP